MDRRLCPAPPTPGASDLSDRPFAARHGEATSSCHGDRGGPWLPVEPRRQPTTGVVGSAGLAQRFLRGFSFAPRASGSVPARAARPPGGVMEISVRNSAALSDLELARRVGKRDPAAVRLMTERNNQRLFRTAWSILGNRAEAEDAVQSAYVRAFAAIDSFAGHASLSTWLTRIVINEALGRERAARRRRARLDANSVTDLDAYREKLMNGSTERGGPEAALAIKEMRGMLESAIGMLPRDFRLVFIMREIEGMTVEEIAGALDILPATVKTRLLRARRRLSEALAPELQASLTGAFPFAGSHCASLTERVVATLCDWPAVPD
ncbi:MAG TPA: RNA polymerase sigma factor [Sphingomonas sp.]|nr:RNA polymerase sigma factor [Sphingomonas sp.]